MQPENGRFEIIERNALKLYEEDKAAVVHLAALVTKPSPSGSANSPSAESIAPNGGYFKVDGWTLTDEHDGLVGSTLYHCGDMHFPSWSLSIWLWGDKLEQVKSSFVCPRCSAVMSDETYLKLKNAFFVMNNK